MRGFVVFDSAVSAFASGPADRGDRLIVTATTPTTARATTSRPARTRRRVEGLIDSGSDWPGGGQPDVAALAHCIATNNGDFSHVCILPPTTAGEGTKGLSAS